MSEQRDLFRPAPDISAATTIARQDVWYDRRRMVWTLDPMDLFAPSAIDGSGKAWHPDDDPLRMIKQRPVQDGATV